MQSDSHRRGSKSHRRGSVGTITAVLFDLYETLITETHVHPTRASSLGPALERLGVRPEAAVFVGDGGDEELAGAERAGLRAWRALWFVRNPTVIAPWPELANPHDVLGRLR